MMKGLMPRQPVCGALTGCAFGVLWKLLEMEEYSY